VTEADVNLAARLDGVGTIVRQKQTLDRVSEVLCDGLEDPAGWWRRRASWLAMMDDTTTIVARCSAIADLIESENL
jgi:hypothetical protein